MTHKTDCAECAMARALVATSRALIAANPPKEER